MSAEVELVGAFPDEERLIHCIEQLQATQASAQLVQAQYNVSTARAQLLAALGRGE